MIKITKFGGSSVADAEQFKKVKAIIEADPSRRFVVSSASGKRFKGCSISARPTCPIPSTICRSST